MITLQIALLLCYVVMQQTINVATVDSQISELCKKPGAKSFVMDA